jgi:hypothetical protein
MTGTATARLPPRVSRFQASHAEAVATAGTGRPPRADSHSGKPFAGTIGVAT